jgi:hypothetical protein
MRLFAGMVVLYVHIAYTFDLLSYVGPDAWINSGRAERYLHFERIWIAPNADWTKLPNSDPAKAETPARSEMPYVQVGRGDFSWSIYYMVTDPAWIYRIHYAFLFVMFLFMIGFCSRVTGVLTWVAALCYIHRAPTTLFGMDTMMVLILTYLMFAPSGARFSVDRWLEKRRQRKEFGHELPVPPSAAATFATRLIQINFCFIYLASGLSKLQGGAWWNGTATWWTMANSYFAPTDNPVYLGTLTYLSKHRWLWEIAMSSGTFGTLFLEIGLPFLIWNKNLRWVMICGSVMLHTFIGLFMGLVTFSLFMIIMLSGFVPPEIARTMIARIGRFWQTISQSGSAAATYEPELARQR